jgi:ketosteroid isomerase-like protein
MAHPNDELLQRFYAAFDRCDGDTMAACYAPDARFDDPVFPGLHGAEPGQMWRMLTSRATDLKIELRKHRASGDAGSAHWIATYTFAQTGRPVVNDVQATFRFENGLIAEHRDDFSFYAWSRQALGTPGLLLGWTPIIRGATQKKARAGLDEFVAGASA